jgi:hypothetical protein
VPGVVRTGVVNDVPAVPTPPVLALYQTGEPLVQLAVSEVELPEQTGEIPPAVGAVGFGFIVTSDDVLELTQFGEPPVSQATK